jgi:hypothetical protein
LDSSIIQGPFSVAPCQTLISRFATFSSPCSTTKYSWRRLDEPSCDSRPQLGSHASPVPWTGSPTPPPPPPPSAAGPAHRGRTPPCYPGCGWCSPRGHLRGSALCAARSGLSAESAACAWRQYVGYLKPALTGSRGRYHKKLPNSPVREETG